jgi:hypothetical protein
MPELGEHDKKVTEAHQRALMLRSSMKLAEKLGAEDEAKGYRKEFYNALLDLAHAERMRDYIITTWVHDELEALKPYKVHTY